MNQGKKYSYDGVYKIVSNNKEKSRRITRKLRMGHERMQWMKGMRRLIRDLAM